MRVRLFRSSEARGAAAQLRSRVGGLVFSVHDRRVAGASIVSVFATAPRLGGRPPLTPAEAAEVAREIYLVAQQATPHEVRVRVLAGDSSVHDYCPMHRGSELVAELVDALSAAPSQHATEDVPEAEDGLRLTVAFSGDATALLKLAGDRPAEEQLSRAASLHSGFVAWLLQRYADEASEAAILAFAEWAAGQLERAARSGRRRVTESAFLQTLDYAPSRTAPSEVEVTVWSSGARCPQGRGADYLPLTLCLFTRALCSPQMPPSIAAETASALRLILDAASASEATG